MAQELISKEVDGMSDEQFLTKMKLLIGGKVTNAAMLLLGNSDFDYLFTAAPSIMWRIYGADGTLLTVLKNKNVIAKYGENQRKANWILKD